MFTHHEDMKGDEKCKNWGGLGGYGPPKVIGNIAIDRAHKTSYLTLIETMCYASILHRFRVIVRFSSKVTNFNPPHLHLWPP